MSLPRSRLRLHIQPGESQCHVTRQNCKQTNMCFDFRHKLCFCSPKLCYIPLNRHNTFHQWYLRWFVTKTDSKVTDALKSDVARERNRLVVFVTLQRSLGAHQAHTCYFILLVLQIVPVTKQHLKWRACHSIIIIHHIWNHPWHWTLKHWFGGYFWIILAGNDGIWGAVKNTWLPFTPPPQNFRNGK